MRSLLALLCFGLLLPGCLDPGAPVVEASGPEDPRVPAGFDVTLPMDGAVVEVPFPVFRMPTRIANQTGRELSLAIDPNNPDRMLACSPTGTLVVGDGHSDVWMTLDGGVTWEVVDPEPGDDTRSHTWESGDCDVAIGPDGTLYLADTWLGGLSVGRSADGRAWTGTAVTVTAPVVDRPWIVIDQQGTLHLTYQHVQAFMPSVIYYTRSTDGGATFLPAVPVTHPDRNGAFTWTGNLVTSDDGQTLHSVYTRRLVPVLSDQESAGAEQVTVATSRDGGLTWTSRVVWNAAGPASWLYPAIARDGQGILYVTWSELRRNDQPTFWRSSADDGATWGQALPFHEGVRMRTGAPWVAGGQSGAAFQFMGTPDLDKPVEAQRWWIYWGLAPANGTPRMGTTTLEPLFVGDLWSFPEFNTVRVDRDGLIHIAAVSYFQEEDASGWRPYHFRQEAGPLLLHGGTE